MPDIVRPGVDSYVHESCFVGNRWVEAGSDEVLEVYDCTTGDRIGRVVSAGDDELARAVASAGDGTRTLASMSAFERAETLRSLQAALRVRADELVSLVCAEVGTAVRLCRPVQVDSAISMIGLIADVAEAHMFTERLGNSYVVREPAGVAVAITPWNFPLFQTVNKVAAAIAAGCAVVHKPSEVAPLTSFVLAEAVAEAELPAGAYNLVPGPGQTVGKALVAHRDVDVVSFTGSAATGAEVYRLAAGDIKRVTLELGGKSASVILDADDLREAVRVSVNRAFMNSGQTCDAWTRLLVPAETISEVADAIQVAVKRLPLGDPFDPATRIGPLISAKQRDRVRTMVQRAVADGARVVTGGPDFPTDFDTGAFFQPTVLTGVTPDMEIAQEEVFGPVLSVMEFRSESEAVELSNSTPYGLSGAVWCSDTARAMGFARKMRTGEVVVNGARFNPLSPFGGFGRSGIGREMGPHGINEYTELKSVQIDDGRGMEAFQEMHTSHRSREDGS